MQCSDHTLVWACSMEPVKLCMGVLGWGTENAQWGCTLYMPINFNNNFNKLNLLLGKFNLHHILDRILLNTWGG